MDEEATKKNDAYYSSEDDGEATKKNDAYYSSEDDGEASKKNEDYYSDGGEDEGGAKSSDPDEDKERAEKETYDEVFEYLTKGTYPQHATLPASSLQYHIFENHVWVHNILGYFGGGGGGGYQISKWDTEYPRIFSRGVQYFGGYKISCDTGRGS